MGIPEDDSGRVLRVSGGFWTGRDEWLGLAGAIQDTWQELEAEGGLAGVVRIP
jgi:hypothetical protein